MIQVANLTKTFGAVEALKGVTFQADDGQVTGLLGPNGAGKTTTLRILYTVLKPNSGAALIDGIDILRQPLQAQQRMGALPDSHGLYPRLSARDNIRYFGQLQGLGGKNLEARIDTLCQMLEMEDNIERRSDGFSTG